MKALITVLVCSTFFISDLNSNTNFEKTQQLSFKKKNCANGVSFTNSTSSTITVLYTNPDQQNSQLQSVTIPAYNTVSIGNYGNPGAWTFRVLGGLDGSIACIETSYYGLTECVTTSSNDRGWHTLFDPFRTSCAHSYEFIFADYPQCN